jgi:hypothetical protein
MPDNKWLGGWRSSVAVANSRTVKKLVEYRNTRWNLNGMPEGHCPRGESKGWQP